MDVDRLLVHVWRRNLHTVLHENVIESCFKLFVCASQAMANLEKELNSH